jgi:hypothetical protein
MGLQTFLRALPPLNISVNGNYDRSRISQMVHGKSYREEDFPLGARLLNLPETKKRLNELKFNSSNTLFNKMPYLIISASYYYIRNVEKGAERIIYYYVNASFAWRQGSLELSCIYCSL